MEPEQHPEGTPVPIDETKVIMKPLPWTERWEKKEFKGIYISSEQMCRTQQYSHTTFSTLFETQKPHELYNIQEYCVKEHRRLEKVVQRCIRPNHLNYWNIYTYQFQV